MYASYTFMDIEHQAIMLQMSILFSALLKKRLQYIKLSFITFQY